MRKFAGLFALFSLAGMLQGQTLYVTDFNSDFVYVYTGFGSAQSTISTAASAEGIAVDGSNDIYVASYSGGSIANSGEEGSPSYGTLSPGATPAGIGLGSGGTLYVSDATNDQISVIAAGGGSTTSFPFGLNGNPQGLTFDTGGNVWVVDIGNGELKEFSSSGTAETSFTITSESGVNPRGVTFANGEFYVAYQTSGDVEEYSTSGTYLGTLATGLSSPWGVTSNQSGDIYVNNSGGGDVLEYASNGSLLGSYTGLTNGLYSATVTAIPEPSAYAWVLGVAALLAAVGRRRLIAG